MTTAAEIDVLVRTVQTSLKYAKIDVELVQALVEQELAKGRNPKDTVKAVRNKLHQIGGAYQESRIDYAHYLEQMKRLPGDLHSPEMINFCLAAMHEHTSTRERLGFLQQYYSEPLAEIAPIPSLIDLACGLNPLSIGWLPLTSNARVEVCDIYEDMMEFLNAFFKHTAVNGQAYTCDLIHHIPQQRVHLALLLKTIPCLEQVDKTIGRRLLTGIQADHMLVSFPVHSLGGRGKGMRENYDQHFQDLVADLPWGIKRFDFTGELLYLMSRQ